MDHTRILPEGSEAKFKITIDDFNMAIEDFEVTLIYGQRQNKIFIPNREMLQSKDGDWYFTFDTSGIVGRVTAECRYYIHDGDFPDGYKNMVDEQYLLFVAATPYPKLICCPSMDEPEDRKVHYELINETDIVTEYVRLCTMSGLPIRTIDGEDLMVLKDENDDNN